MTSAGLLVAVLANPPLTSGTRTSARVDLAARLLGYDECRIVNMFAGATRSTRDISETGASPEHWTSARPALIQALRRADAVLLAYGTEPPRAAARYHFRSQVEWLDLLLDESGADAWWVGGAPRHPSRWQRYTHRVWPDCTFPEALQSSLGLRAQGSGGPQARSAVRPRGQGE